MIPIIFPLLNLVILCYYLSLLFDLSKLMFKVVEKSVE